LVSVGERAWKKRNVETAAARDYYEVLGVSRAADADTIKRAFRAQARKYHPDVSEEPDAEDRFRELAEAYSALSQPASRLLYDRFGYRGPPGASASAITDFLQFWARSRSRRRGARAGAVAEVELGFYEAARGVCKTIRYRRQVDCPSCDLAGESCPTCGGRGTVRHREASGDMLVLQLTTCEACAGTGRLASSECGTCGGRRTIEEERKVEVSIPSGVADGERVRVPGDEGAFVLVRVAPQPADSTLVRAVAAVGFAAAVALVALILLN
jgi:molecular chaperone DnaJ